LKSFQETGNFYQKNLNSTARLISEAIQHIQSLGSKFCGMHITAFPIDKEDRFVNNWPRGVTSKWAGLQSIPRS